MQRLTWCRPGVRLCQTPDLVLCTPPGRHLNSIWSRLDRGSSNCLCEYDREESMNQRQIASDMPSSAGWAHLHRNSNTTNKSLIFTLSRVLVNGAKITIEGHYGARFARCCPNRNICNFRWNNFRDTVFVIQRKMADYARSMQNFDVGLCPTDACCLGS